MNCLLATAVKAIAQVGFCGAALVVALAPPVPAEAQDQASAPQADVRVYNSDIHDPGDGKLNDEAPTISLAGAPNGTFSGKVVVAAAQAVEGLKVVASELKQGAGAIPTSCLSVRYGIPWDPTIGDWNSPRGADILLESPLAKFPTLRGGAGRTPVWLTVRAPKDAAPGAYSGQLTIEAGGMKPVRVPVKLELQGWTLPDTQDWRTWVELVQSPDTLAEEYKIPLWSEKHWQMIAKSLDFIGRTGSRVVYVPLICHTNQGNEESMVRWVRKGNDSFEYDFSVMDKYLDLAEQHMGRSKIVVFYVWEVYLNVPKGAENVVVTEEDKKDRFTYDHKAAAAARWALRDKGPAVTLLNPATKKTELFYLPRYENPASKALWQLLWAKLRERLEKRGLGKSMMLGAISDIWPKKEEVAFWNEVSSNLPWTSASHHARWVLDPGAAAKGGQLHQLATVGYTAVALDFQYVIDPSRERCYGWKKPLLHGQYWRFQYFNTSTHSTIRHEAEANITGNQRGIARLGADFWWTIKNKQGARRGTVADRCPESFWHSLGIGSWMLGPGPDGPVGTGRLEVFREGVQECEARIAIESALTDSALRARLGDELAGRAQNLLDDQQRDIWKAQGAPEADLQNGLIREYRQIYEMRKKWDAAGGNRWFISSGWQGRVAKLYALAGEVERKLRNESPH